MRILLPPSETKSSGGTGGPLDLDALGFPELNPLRDSLITALVALAARPQQARVALGTTARQDDEIARNAMLRSAPTTPALTRYTGVLYDFLDLASLRPAARARAGDTLVVVSALFGALRAGDLIPAYRLSAASSLPRRPTLAALWRPVLAPLLASHEGLTVDLRSSGYLALAPLPDAVTVRVLTEAADGSRSVVSHANKSTKGLLVRALLASRSEIDDVAALLRVLRRSGFTVERRTPTGLDVILR